MFIKKSALSTLSEHSRSMATVIHPPLTPVLPQPEACGLKLCVEGDPKPPIGDPVPLPEPLGNSTHAALQVKRSPKTPSPKSFSVEVLNGSDGTKVSVSVRSIDTIAKLQKKVLKLKPDLGCGNLAYNGKPVLPCKKLSELQVKPEAVFVTYRKCVGG